jgi:hypothetical protein
LGVLELLSSLYSVYDGLYRGRRCARRGNEVVVDVGTILTRNIFSEPKFGDGRSKEFEGVFIGSSSNRYNHWSVSITTTGFEFCEEVCVLFV